ncbi:MAG: helix-turn-helix transcriptional regulator [Halobacteriales archaeon]
MAVSSSGGLRAVVLIAVIGLLVGGILTPVATDEAAAQQAQPETDNTVTRIEAFENGSARWTVRIRTRLDTDQRVEDYTAFQRQFRNNVTRYLGPFHNRMEGVVADAGNATGRQMRATNFTASTSVQEVPRRWGVVTYEFMWTNFAAKENGQVTVGDTFQGGFFIANNDTLQVVAPDGHEITRADPDPDSRENGMVTWNGREDFGDAQPRVVFTPMAEGTDGTIPATTSDAPSTGSGSLLENIGGPAVVGTVVVILLGLGGAVAYGRRNNEAGGPAGPAEGDKRRTGTPSATDDEISSDAQGSQETVLTDDERVLELLEANGGRMRQAAIAETFDWSASKTSRVIGRMADEESVEKLQLGRENLVALPDEIM